MRHTDFRIQRGQKKAPIKRGIRRKDNLYPSLGLKECRTVIATDSSGVRSAQWRAYVKANTVANNRAIGVDALQG